MKIAEVLVESPTLERTALAPTLPRRQRWAKEHLQDGGSGRGATNGLVGDGHDRTSPMRKRYGIIVIAPPNYKPTRKAMTGLHHLLLTRR